MAERCMHLFAYANPIVFIFLSPIIPLSYQEPKQTKKRLYKTLSYEPLHGSYRTIPLISTQGTTKEDDKDYIVRVSLAPTMNLKRHKEVFKNFVDQI